MKLENKPTEQVDLVWYYNDSYMVKFGLEQVDRKLCVVMGREQKDRARTIAVIAYLMSRDNPADPMFKEL